MIALSALGALALLSMGFASYGRDIQDYSPPGHCSGAAQYTSEQLRAWSRVLADYRDAFGRQGFLYLGPSVRCGKSPTFMVRDRFAKSRLERQLRQLGIPADAVSVRYFLSIGGYAYFEA